MLKLFEKNFIPGIRELSLSEIELVSGGSANGQDTGERSNYGRSVYTNGNRGISYGGQANRFQPNYASGATGANMYNDLTSNCGLGMVGGVLGFGATAASKSAASGGAAITGIIAGCKPDIKSASSSGAPFR